ncbi:response regulator [bacterium]|nr:response regulator [bacterium]
MEKKINILIVDDDKRSSEILGTILEDEGYKIMCVETIARAKEEAAENIYHLALIDIKLSDGSGWELLKEIKRINQETKVIILSGVVTIKNSDKAINEGVFAFVQKPFDVDGLKEIIRKALKM